MRRSLRLRLTVAIVGVLTVLFVCLSLVLHAVFARALYRQFDGRLLGDAAAIAGMAEDESPEVEFESESLPDFDSARRPSYFEAWLDDGRVLARSPSLGERDLARPGRPAAPVFTDLALPDGRAGRGVELRQPLRIEAPARPDGSPLAGLADRFVTVVVARGTEELVETLALVRGWLFGLTLLSLLAASGVALLVVSRGLRSTRALAAKISDLDASRLDSVLPSEGLPDEIAPVVAKINELLARLRESFLREKRFTADVSHELRTPLAGLRTTLEVAASRERAAPEYRAAIEQAGAVVLEMQALCENLLALARLDARLVPDSSATGPTAQRSFKPAGAHSSCPPSTTKPHLRERDRRRERGRNRSRSAAHHRLEPALERGDVHRAGRDHPGARRSGERPARSVAGGPRHRSSDPGRPACP